MKTSGKDAEPISRNALITRSAESSAADLALLTDAGIVVTYLPTIELVKVQLHESVLKNLRDGFYDWIVFTSANSVRFFFSQASAEGIRRANRKISVASIGEKTTEALKNEGIKPDLTPVYQSAFGLIFKFSELSLAGKKMLLPGSDIARKELILGLTDLDAIVQRAVVYENRLPDSNAIAEPLAAARAKKMDAYIFTSPSTYDNFLELLAIKKPGKYFAKSFVAAIGESTAIHIGESGVEPVMCPRVPTVAALGKIVLSHFNEKRSVHEQNKK